MSLDPISCLNLIHTHSGRNPELIPTLWQHYSVKIPNVDDESFLFFKLILLLSFDMKILVGHGAKIFNENRTGGLMLGSDPSDPLLDDEWLAGYEDFLVLILILEICICMHINWILLGLEVTFFLFLLAAIFF